MKYDSPFEISGAKELLNEELKFKQNENIIYNISKSCGSLNYFAKVLKSHIYSQINKHLILFCYI